MKIKLLIKNYYIYYLMVVTAIPLIEFFYNLQLKYWVIIIGEFLIACFLFLGIKLKKVHCDLVDKIEVRSGHPLDKFRSHVGIQTINAMRSLK
jgi:hypothetical protein